MWKKNSEKKEVKCGQGGFGEAGRLQLSLAERGERS